MAVPDRQAAADTPQMRRAIPRGFTLTERCYGRQVQCLPNVVAGG